MKSSKFASTAFTHVALVLLSILFVLPLLWMLSTSLKPITETLSNPPRWIPSKVLWSNYPDAIKYNSDQLGYIPFLVYLRNTVIVTILTVTGAVISNALVAYSFARLKWKGRDAFFALTLATMMIPFPVLMVPTFSLFRWLGWVGTFKPLWVPAFFASAFSIFLLRQFFKTIPMELSEAAKLDGCSEFRIFTDIIAPLAKPALMVVALFTFMGSWNDFLGPLIYLVDQKTFTLSLGLSAYQTQHGGTPWNLLMAATLLVILPVIIVFFFAQKVFIQGIATSGLK
ncbi:MAG: sugar ABC transporter ATP-binding protein [Armatimonadetes bacterium 55-13]|mgnify:CR=1 FL=1|nr:carbohydrate ABC transporter permease [Armatimonadota bacterium]OJU62849.1 MAG: sugar ABC transporter ATP-binding protein [Armatimonadetes bacterium 55-13]